MNHLDLFSYLFNTVGTEKRSSLANTDGVTNDCLVLLTKTHNQTSIFKGDTWSLIGQKYFPWSIRRVTYAFCFYLFSFFPSNYYVKYWWELVNYNIWWLLKTVTNKHNHFCVPKCCDATFYGIFLEGTVLFF